VFLNILAYTRQFYLDINSDVLQDILTANTGELKKLRILKSAS
jgi:hypothetical protein